MIEYGKVQKVNLAVTYVKIIRHGCDFRCFMKTIFHIKRKTEQKRARANLTRCIYDVIVQFQEIWRISPN